MEPVYKMEANKWSAVFWLTCQSALLHVSYVALMCSYIFLRPEGFEDLCVYFGMEMAKP
jgi:hypothetical protein